MTEEGKSMLIAHEGEILHAYEDSLGFLTIGIGHLIDARKGGGIPKRISRELFEDDVNIATARARMAFPWFDGLDPVRQDAIVNLVFNLGLDGVKGFRLMCEAMERHDWERAAYELYNSRWSHQVQRERCQDLIGAIEKGKWA